jgi:hypothetical protein
MNSEPHFTIRIENHQTAQWLQVELMDLPFAVRKYEIRVKRKSPQQTRYATKTQSGFRQYFLMFFFSVFTSEQ